MEPANGKAPGFARCPNELIRDGNGSQNRVYARLDFYLDKRTGFCCPSIARLAVDLDLSKKQVARILQWLEANGWIIVERETGQINRYVTERGPNGVFALSRTRDINVPGTRDTNVPGTRDINVPGTRDTNVPGCGIPP